MYNETVRSNVPGFPMKIAITGGGGQSPKDIPIHFHDEIELLPIFEGTLVCVMDGKELVARKGDVVFINSRTSHLIRALEEGTRWGVLQFRLKDFVDTEIERIVRYSLKYRTALGNPVRIVSDESFFSLLCEVLREAEAKGQAYEMFVKSGVYRALGYLYRAGILSSGEELYQKKEVQKILPALAYINKHYAEPISLDTISAELGFNQS